MSHQRRNTTQEHKRSAAAENRKPAGKTTGADAFVDMRTGAPLQRQLASMANAPGPVVQRKPKKIMIDHRTRLRERNGDSLLEGTPETHRLTFGTTVEIETSKTFRSRMGNQGHHRDKYRGHTPDHVWYKVIRVDTSGDGDWESYKGKSVYLLENTFVTDKSGIEQATERFTPGSDELREPSSVVDTLSTVVDKGTSIPAGMIGNEGITGVADALNDKTIRTSTNMDDPLNTSTEEERKHATNLGIVGDSITGVVGVMGLIKGFKDLDDPEKSAADLVEIGLGIEQSAMKVGESVSKLVNTGTEGGDKTAAAFGSTFEAFAAGFGAIKEGFMAMRKLVNLIKKHNEMSGREIGQQSGEIVIHALEAAKNVVLTIKAFYELIEGGASGALMAAVPGADIAISAVKITMQGYYAIVSNASRRTMNERRKKIALSTTDPRTQMSHSVAEMEAGREFYRTRDAEIVNKKKLIEEDEALIQKINDTPNPSSKDIERRKKRIARVAKLKQDIVVLQQNKSPNGLDESELAEYTMVTELRDINTKRAVRQTIHIASEMAKIAGSIATLTGYGGIAGGVIKGAALAVDVGMPVVRAAKQFGRDRAAREAAKGNTKSKFDYSKSTAAKQAFRTQQIKTLLTFILNAKIDDQADLKTVNQYLKATGVSTRKLYRLNGKPKEQMKLLLEAIEQREFI